MTDSHPARSRFRHSLYGLQMDLPFALPGLATSAAHVPADVVVRNDDVPATLQTISSRGARFQAAPGTLLAWMDGVARYLVLNGQEIIIHAEPGGREEDVRVLLLSTPVGALLQQRGMLPLHASVVATEQGAILLLGASGVGKSSLAAMLTRRGFSCLSDDVAAVTIGPDGSAWVHSGLPQLHLWPDVLSSLGESPESHAHLRPTIAKRILLLGDKFRAAALPIMRIYHLDSDVAAPGLSLHALGPAKRLEALVDLTYRAEFLQGLGLRATHFSLVARTVAKVPVFRLIRPDDNKVRLTEMADLVIGNLSS